MIRHLFKLNVLMLVIFALLSSAAHVVGMTQPQNQVLADFSEGCEGKPQACWYGIVPGVTSMTDVKYKMSQYTQAHELPALPFRLAYQLSNVAQVYFDSLYNITVDHIILKLDDHISTGEVLGALGPPDRILFRTGTEPISYIFHYETADMHVVMLEKQSDILNPHRDTSVLMDMSALLQPLPTAGFRWHGFAPFWKYCQAEARQIALCQAT